MRLFVSPEAELCCGGDTNMTHVLCAWNQGWTVRMCGELYSSFPILLADLFLRQKGS